MSGGGSNHRVSQEEKRRPTSDIMLVGMAELGFDRNFRGGYEKRGRESTEMERGFSPGVRAGGRGSRPEEEGKKKYYCQEWGRGARAPYY